MEKYLRIAIILILSVFFSFIIFGYSYILSDEGTNYQVVSFKPLEAGEVTEKAGVNTRPEDIVSQSSRTLINPENVTIKRSKPVNLELDGELTILYTMSITIREFLKEKNINLNVNDYISEPLNAELNDNQVIVIKTYKEIEKIVKEPIPYNTIYEEGTQVYKGLVFLRQSGKDGVLEKHYKEFFFGGKKLKEVFAYDKISKMAITQVYVKGSAEAPKKYLKSFSVISTAYSPTFAETDGDPWTTASGLRSGFGVVAVDPKVIPLGTLLYVDGYGYAVAGDTGGAIKGNKIDVFFYSKWDSVKWGVRTVKVYILQGKWKFPEKLND